MEREKKKKRVYRGRRNNLSDNMKAEFAFTSTAVETGEFDHMTDEQWCNELGERYGEIVKPDRHLKQKERRKLRA